MGPWAETAQANMWAGTTQHRTTIVGTTSWDDPCRPVQCKAWPKHGWVERFFITIVKRWAPIITIHKGVPQLCYEIKAFL